MAKTNKLKVFEIEKTSSTSKGVQPLATQTNTPPKNKTTASSLHVIAVRQNRVAVTFLVQSPTHGTPKQEKEVLPQAVRNFRLVGVQGRQSAVQPGHDAKHDTSDIAD